jgi:2-polyprenyl-6-hydroxyphenyl methylase/3-demethylubiquinone-9 3-methyltransferase
MVTSTTNVDQAEKRKFDALAASWWDPQGESRPLHELNPARLRFIRERVALADASVVDVGCGGGILSESLSAAGARVTGLDIAPKALTVARLHLHESGLEVDYREATVEAYSEEYPESADVVTCMELLEHVPDPVSVVQSCVDTVKPGGHLFFSTLNRTPAAFALAILGAEYIARLIPQGTHRYDRFIKPSELSSWLRQAGVTVSEICGLHYNPVSRTARTGGRVSVNYMAHARKPGKRTQDHAE